MMMKIKLAIFHCILDYKKCWKENDKQGNSNREEAGIPNLYSRQGEEQPFGYTGYRYDGISGTYFAQAREYQPQNGRFTAQDVIQGNGAYPETLNRYGYCWNMPVSYVDRDGKIGYFFYDPYMFYGTGVDMDTILEMDLASLSEQYQTEIKPIKMTTENKAYTSFQDSWEEMKEEGGKIDVVVIMTHSYGGGFVSETFSTVDEETGEIKRNVKKWFEIEEIPALKDKEIGTLYLFGCNMGVTKPKESNNSIASMFYTEKTPKNIGTIIAADGRVHHSYLEGKRILYVTPSKRYQEDGNSDGFKRYEMVNGKVQITPSIDISDYWGEISSFGYGGDEEEVIGEKKIDEKKKKK